MGSLSIWHILILALIALVLFGGRGKVSDLMGDFGRGINSF
jgi:sec-independent protein translocase protein TatA